MELPGITLVGTAHVSKESVREVLETIARVKPAIVAVELDENRRKALVDKKAFEATPITDLLKGGRGSFILAQTLLASYQRRMGAKEGVEPGAEMLAAIQAATAAGAQVELVDRDIGVTLRRAYGLMRFGEKMRLTWELFKSVMGAEDEEEIRVDEMLQEDVLTTMMADMAAMAPTVANVLIHERDAYLAANIREAAKGGHVVAVLGAGHLKGVEQHLLHPERPIDKAPLELIPKKKFPVGKAIGWALILSILGVFAWGFYRASREAALATSWATSATTCSSRVRSRRLAPSWPARTSSAFVTAFVAAPHHPAPHPRGGLVLRPRRSEIPHAHREGLPRGLEAPDAQGVLEQPPDARAHGRGPHERGRDDRCLPGGGLAPRIVLRLTPIPVGKVAVRQPEPRRARRHEVSIKAECGCPLRAPLRAFVFFVVPSKVEPQAEGDMSLNVGFIWGRLSRRL